jgi:hypothetical protein
LLDKDAEITLWNEGFFRLGETFIETLVNALPRFDFALLVLTSDDLVNSRGVEMFGARDNVVFELGLFIGSLGRERTFMLHQANATVKIPSDLSGVSMASYDWPRADNSSVAAVGAACSSVRRAIQELGVSDKKVAQAIGDIRSHQQRHDYEISKQRAEIRALQFALRGIVTRCEEEKLVRLEEPGPFLCWYSNDLYNEIRRLRAMGFVENLSGVGLRNIREGFKNKNQQFDLKHFFSVAPEGREYLRLRREVAEDAIDSQN